MKNYCLYYLPKTKDDPNSDLLTIYFGELKFVTNRVDYANYAILYNKDDEVGYIIKNFSSYCKIKVNGTLFLPNHELIDLINSVLTNFGLESLSYKEQSGFLVGQIINKTPKMKCFIYEIDIGSKKIFTESSYDLKVNSKVIIALNDTYLLPARIIKEYCIKDKIFSGGRICNYEDVQMNSADIYEPLLVLDKIDNGKDFFSMEVKYDA